MVDTPTNKDNKSVTNRIDWTKEDRDTLSRQWSNSQYSMKMILNYWSKRYPEVERKKLRNRLKKQANRLGCTWNQPGIYDVNLPVTDLDNPYVIRSKWNNTKLKVINSPYIGVAADTSIFTNALRFAQLRNCDAVIITGNLFYIDVIQFSKNTPFRARVSSIEPDKDLIKYPDAVKKEFGDINERLARGDLIYIPFREKFDHLIEMVKKAIYKNRKIVFEKPIYIRFGKIEEALGSWLTTDVIRERIEIERTKVSMMIVGLNQSLREAKKADNLAECNRLEDEINQWKIYKKVYLKMSTVAEFQTNNIFNQMRDYIIRKIEAIAPNIKFISTGDAYVKIGKDKSEKIYCITHRASESAADTFMDQLMKDTRKSIGRGERQPDMVLGGGTNITLNTIPVSYLKKSKVTSVEVTQLPIAVDAKILRKRVSRGITKGNVLFKLVTHKDFEAGTTIIEWVNGFPRFEICPDCFLTNNKIFNSSEKFNNLDKGKYLIYKQIEGDKHHGQKTVLLYETDEFPYFHFHDVVVNNFLEDAPILAFTDTGDSLQGHNHDYERDTHEDYKFHHDMIESLRKKRKKIEDNGESEKKQLEDLSKEQEKEALKNTIRAGILMGWDQFESFVELRIRPNLKHYYNIIKRGEIANLDIRGKLGNITLLSGNHYINSYEGEFPESKMIRMLMIALLRIEYPELSEKELRKKISAPMLSPKVALAEGGMGINPEPEKYNDKEILHQDKYYYYGIFSKHKHAGSSKFADSMKKMRDSTGNRGTTSPWLQDRFIIYISGHTHYGGMTTSRNSLLIRAGSQTLHDSFGERMDFPLNNISTEVIGLPFGGPETGPKIKIPLRYEEFQYYVKEHWEVDKNKLFANSVVKGKID